MSEYHFPVPGADEKKEIVVFVRRHWASFLGQFLLSFLVLIMPIAVWLITLILGFNATIFRGLVVNVLVLFFSAYYLMAITFAFVSWLSFYYNIYIITKLDIIDIEQVGFFGRKISQLSLLRVQDVSSSIKGLAPTFFAYGDVLVETASEQKEAFLLRAVPNPQEISAKIMELHDEVIEREGRHHQLLEGEGALMPGRIAKEASPELLEPLVSQEEKTSYQKLLEKDKEEKTEEGEITKNDLNKGGEIKL